MSKKTVTLSFKERFEEHGMIIIKARYDNTQDYISIIIDTGASFEFMYYCIFTPEGWKKEPFYYLDEPVEARDYTKGYMLQRYIAPTLWFGDVRVKCGMFLWPKTVEELEEIEEQQKKEYIEKYGDLVYREDCPFIHAAFGAGFLKAYKAVIDYGSMTITLTEPD